MFTENCVFSNFFTVFLLVFSNFLWDMGSRVFYQSICQLAMHSISLFFDWLWFSIMVSSCCKENFPWWGVGTTLIWGNKDKYLECNYELFWFSRVVIIGFPSRSMTSLALVSLLYFQYPAQFSSCWEGFMSN